MSIEIVQINWSKLYPFNKALNQPEAKEFGVYALYKTAGGNKKLFYIGKSKDFITRFSTHRQNIAHMLSEKELNKCYVSFGFISSFDKSRVSSNISPEQLRNVESFLINELLPQGNDSSTKKGYKGMTIIAINGGKFIKPFKKVMIHNSTLEKLLKDSFKTKKTSAYDF